MEAEIRKTRKAGIVASKTAIAAVLLFITVIVLFPLYYMAATSLKTYTEYISNPLGLRFGQLAFSNYTDVLAASNILRATLNSVTVSAAAVILTVIFSAVASFAIGVIRFKGSRLLYFLAISSMFVTGEMAYVPMYLLYNRLNLLNTFSVLLLPHVFAIPGLGIILGSNYIRKIPKEVHEAAIIEGASLFYLFRKIDLRLLAPIMSVAAIMTFQNVWSDFFWPLITVMGNPSAHTLPLMLVGFRAADASMFGQYCAGLVIMTAPIVLIYCLFSKYFIRGVATGAVKG
jgi:ABC-type glycerol-3-phosphate transport system permease component